MDPDAEPSPVPDLVSAARDGDASAWQSLVERYTPLVLCVVRRSGLRGGDAEDAVQTVWLRLVEHLGDLREPRALPGWIATTARNQCMRVSRARGSVTLTDLSEGREPASDEMSTAVETRLLDQERHEALLAAVAELPERQRQLVLLMIEDPPLSYEEISRRLGIPVGSIGPTRARAFARIRAFPAMTALIGS